MTTLTTSPSIVLDEGAHDFISTFMSHVGAVAGYDENRLVTIAHVKQLLLAAIAQGNGTTSLAWRRLHRSIGEIVASAKRTRDAEQAYDYLAAFVRENGDLDRA